MSHVKVNKVFKEQSDILKPAGKKRGRAAVDMTRLLSKESYPTLQASTDCPGAKRLGELTAPKVGMSKKEEEDLLEILLQSRRPGFDSRVEQ